ncbi:MAG: hypothetical protein CBC25_07685 [Pelagibacteraceae bacterium TMED65]|nr:MAG: hypothetical protein CBC25_07685 [Pelagibacteraceae bacterium TMED65]|tara:strand:- start:3318 stop:4448 length:1131 start_codon:yes stop_codon:yes gene_type:complete
MNFLFDIPNLLVCIIAIIIACRIQIIPNWIGFIFIGYSFVPFILNDFLFPARYMKDQFFYLYAMQEVRSFNIIPDIDYSQYLKAFSTSWLLSFLPLPYVETIKSLGFFNRFLFFVTFCWLYNKKFLTGMPLLFVLFYPSLLLYTSLSLRDPLILCLMIIGVIFVIDKKYLKFFVTTVPLFFLKFQNFYFIIVFFSIYIFFNNKDYFKKNLLIFFGLSIVLIYPFFDQILSSIDMYRGAMYRVDGGDMSYYQPINNLFSLIKHSIISFPYFMIKPFPWEAENIFQLIQSIENFLILIFLFFFSKTSYEQSRFITIKWILYSVFVMTTYSLVVYNYGTSARYRFIFIVLYVIGLSYELYKIKGYKFNFQKKNFIKLTK